MIDRQELTPEIVDAATLTQSGEKWVADTKLPGFGLRIWKTGKALSFRVSDTDGRPVRQSFQPDPSRLFIWGDRQEIYDERGRLRLGLFLDQAREWARLEIARAKGTAPSKAEQDRLDQEKERQRLFVRESIEKTQLLDLAEDFIVSGPGRGWSEEYTARMHSLLGHLPQDLLRLPVGMVNGSSYEQVLTSKEIGDGTAMALRHLLHQIHRHIHDIGGPPYGNVWSGLNRLGQKRGLNEVEAFAEELSHNQIELLFSTLNDPRYPRVASLCLQAALLTQLPVARCMRAEWRRVAEERWYPYLEGESTYWYARWCRVTGRLEAILAEARELSGRSSPFIFPSPRTPERHIARVDHAWSAVLAQLEWPYGRVSTYSKLNRHLRPYVAKATRAE